MRLIDADAYANEMRKKQENCRAWKDRLDEGTELYARAEQSFVTFVEAALTLKSQPTIDAIPVEWLDDRANDITRAPMFRRYAQQLLDEWQKEQEER